MLVRASPALLVLLAIGFALSGRAVRAEEPVIVNCSFELEWCEAMRVKYEAVTGKKAVIARKTDGEILAEAKAEAGNPRFDVWHSAGPDVAAIARQQDLLESYKSPMLSQLYDWAQKAAAATDYTMTPIYTGVIGFGYNTELLEYSSDEARNRILNRFDKEVKSSPR